MNAATVKELEASVQDWMDKNPPKPRERKRQYARRAWDAVSPKLKSGRKAGFDWSIIVTMLPIILRIIEMIIERRKQS
jgi:hypothetical protein